MTDHSAAAALLDDWASRAGKAAPKPVEPQAPADMLFRIAPEKLCIPGYDDSQEGDPYRNALPIDPAMVLSVMALGVLEPIIVRKRPDGVLEVIAGRQRTRHAREANRRLLAEGEHPITVLVNIKGGRFSPEMAFIVDTTLNEHRVNDPPSVKVRKAAKMAAQGIAVLSIATAYRVEPQMVERWLQASRASMPVAIALDAGKITIATAADLSLHDELAQIDALEKLALIAPQRSAEAAVARAIVRREPLPGSVPKRAVRWILDAPEQFSADFIRGIKFVRGELTAEEVREILERVGR